MVHSFRFITNGGWWYLVRMVMDDGGKDELSWYGGRCGRDDFFGKVQAVLRLGHLIGIMLAVRERTRKRCLRRRWKATEAAIYSSAGMAAVVAEAIFLAKFRRCFD
ncbi:hypothetical protein Fot_55669 [Forsythia ovata]|uniref:Uncharacterized protein n=1 Tax=Forsythia ovata TaxID=205694 RepID=A0ABD1P4Q2_9LAMI